MDPLRAFLDYLQRALGSRVPAEVLNAIETQTQTLFAKFELVPKADYEAQVDILKSLEAQVEQLEARLAALEQPSQP